MILRRAWTVQLVWVLLASAVLGCSHHTPSAPTAALPKVSGAVGSKPSLSFPQSNPPASEQRKVLKQGDGRPVTNGDLMVTNYFGQVWNGPVFDNSYDGGVPAGLVIGKGKVIPAWDDALVGVKAGSRLLLIVPPSRGYGKAGNARFGIRATDTLVYVIDVLSSYGSEVIGDPKAVPQKLSIPGVIITGAPGQTPTVTVTKAAETPVRPVLRLLARGTGPKIGKGLLIVQYVVARYDRGPVVSTYTTGPVAIRIASSARGTPFDLVRGVTVGSRAVLLVPGSKGMPATAAVVDFISDVASR